MKGFETGFHCCDFGKKDILYLKPIEREKDTDPPGIPNRVNNFSNLNTT